MMRPVLDVLNRSISALLETDPETKEKLTQMQGRVLCIEMTVPSLSLYLLPGENGFELSDDCEGEPDVKLSGTLLSFAQLSNQGISSGVLSDGHIRMEGDVEVGQAFQKILGQLDLDWEELVSHYIGDFPARKMGNLVRGLSEWAKESVNQTRENTGEYLQEEKRILVTPLRMERFETNVNLLRSAIDRLEQRVNHLKL